VRTRLAGIPASPGIVIGPVHLLHWEVPDVPQRIITDDHIEPEIRRFQNILRRAGDRLQSVRDRTAARAGDAEAAIFEVQLQILSDNELTRRVETLIRQNLAAETAFDLTMLEWRHNFARSASPMMRERVADITDVQIRVLSLLLGLPDHDPVDVPKGSHAVLVTHDLTPSLTVQLDREAIAAIATDAGTRVSHVAILARSLGIPAVVGLRTATAALRGGERVVLDGSAGVVWLEPSAEEESTFRDRAQRQKVERAKLAQLATSEPVTTDGVRITIRANVDIPEEADLAAHSGAVGVGLMRTEFLVVGRATMPDEDEQTRAYTRVVEAFGDAPVVIRTYDIGGDKLPVGGFPVEANPFLGWRAIRVCLDEPELFKTQLRALLRAGMHGDVRIMLPLIVSVDEVQRAKALMREASAELDARGVPHRKELPVGVMVETPAAAIAADTFVGEADFFSIGTNDLTQYTLAVDRGNANLASRFLPLHPGVLRLIRRVVDVGAEHDIEVAVCGEMASQPIMAFALIGLGVRQLSVAPQSVPLVKRVIRGVSASVAASALAEALVSTTPAMAEEILNRCLVKQFGDDPFLHDGLPDL